jgi:hypothetical protein
MTGVIGAVIAGVLGSQLLEFGPSGTSFLTLLGFMVGYSCTRPHSIAWATFPPRPNMAPDWGMSIFRDGRRDADAVAFRAFIERVQAQILNTRTATSENSL